MKKIIYTVSLIVFFAIFGPAALKIISNSAAESSTISTPISTPNLQSAAPDNQAAPDNTSSIAKKLSILQTRAACDSEPVAGAMPYNEEYLKGRQDILQVVSTQVKYTEKEKAYTGDPDYLLNNLQWAAQGNPALVLCVREDPLSELLETCEYEAKDQVSLGRVNRFYGEVELKLVETATGTVIASQVLGQEAAACNPVEIFSPGTDVKTLRVDNFAQTFESEISEFIRPHVEKFL